MGLLHANAGVTRRCTKVSAQPLNRFGRIRAPRRLPSSGTHAHRNLCVATEAFMVAQARLVFPMTFVNFPSSSFSASRHPEQWREPHYFAFDRLRRRSSAVYSVCILPLIHPGRISAPWLPTTYARLPLRDTRFSSLSSTEVASWREDFTSRVLGSNEPLCQFSNGDSAAAV